MRLEAGILDEARAAVRGVLEQGRRGIEEQVARIRFELGRDSERIARDVATKVLGREVG
jgi:hypothetical protein